MAKLGDFQKSKYVKLALIGNSGAGKTGALTSLVKAGYKLRIYDTDTGLDALFAHVMAECPERIDQIEYESFRDTIKMTATGPVVKGSASAIPDLMAALEKWPDDGSDPATWGPDTIVVIDSLTNVGRAALKWAQKANPSTKDPRQWYNTAQGIVTDLIANLTDTEFKTNVIIISHIEITELQGMVKGFISSIGKALGPKLPSFFNTLILSETKGSGVNLKRTLKTLPTALIDLKNPKPMKMLPEYPIETGLADIFSLLKE